MTDRDDGGPAFPWGEHGTHLGGMSIRDYFAAQAMPHALTYQLTGHEYYERVAATCYELADAMLVERNKP